MIEAPHAVSADAFIGGRVEAEQPLAGHHRAGLEAVLIAAAVPAHARGTVVDLGAGAGVAGFCVAARCPATSVVLVERDAALVGAMRSSLARPANAGFAPRVRIVQTDIAAPEAEREAAGLAREDADFAILNPPFHAAGAVRRPAGDSRAAAHLLGEDGLDPWFRAAASVLRPGGTVIAIFPAAGLEDLLAAAGSRFGALELLPIHPRAGRPALRLLLRGRKGSRGGTILRPGLTLHETEGNRYVPAVDALLRDGADLASAAPGWPADPD
ncbi:MAG: methyltransferase [Bauldia sp.]|nr:methyltransferase [Bauldia sp.]